MNRGGGGPGGPRNNRSNFRGISETIQNIHTLKPDLLLPQIAPIRRTTSAVTTWVITTRHGRAIAPTSTAATTCTITVEMEETT